MTIVKEIGTKRTLKVEVRMSPEEVAFLDELAKEQGKARATLLREGIFLTFGELLPIGYKIMFAWSSSEAGEKAKRAIWDFAQRHPDLRPSRLLAEKYGKS